MKLENKLEIALYGYNIQNPASVFTYIWNAVGVPIKEEDVRKVLPIVEDRHRDPEMERVHINRIINQLRDDLSKHELDQVTDKQISRILQKFGYKGSNLERLTSIITDALPEMDQLDAPEGPAAIGPDELDLETLRKFKKLEDVPEIEKQPVPHEKKYQIKYGQREKSRVPSSYQKRQQKVSSAFRPGYVTHQRRLFDKDGDKDIENRKRRAREILKGKK